MSHYLLEDAKAFLDVFHSADDAKLQKLLDGAEKEALDYLDRSSFEEFLEADRDTSSSEPEIPAVCETAVFFLLQSVYQAKPEERHQLREAAETMLFPHRRTLGV